MTRGSWSSRVSGALLSMMSPFIVGKCCGAGEKPGLGDVSCPALSRAAGTFGTTYASTVAARIAARASLPGNSGCGADNRGERMTVTAPSPAPEGVFETKNSQAAGRSAPGVFRSETFDFQLMRWLSKAPYSGSEIGECYATAHLLQ